MRSFSPPDRLVGWLLPTLAIIAEAALITVVYVALVTALEGRTPILGTLEMAAAAGLTATAVRRGWVDPDERVVGFLGLVLGLGAAGWLWDAEARSLLLAGNPVDALAVHASGWLAVVAAMRGVGRAFEIDDRSMSRLVLAGVPALGIPWALGLLGPVELRAAFTEGAFVASLTFVAAGFVAAGLARLSEIGRETGVDWRHDRSWMGTVFAVLAAVLAIGVPASLLLGLPGTAVARGLLDPMITALAYALIVVIALGAMAAGLIASALRALGFAGLDWADPATGRPILPDVVPYTVEELRGPLTGLGLAWLVVGVVLFVLVTVWVRRRRRPRPRHSSDERTFRLSGPRPPATRPPRTPPRPRRRVTAADAITAYLAALELVAVHDPPLAQAAHETPRSHARRVGLGPELDALQAAYALARYGARSLSPAEHRRALDRWRRLRDRLPPAATDRT